MTQASPPSSIPASAPPLPKSSSGVPTSDSAPAPSPKRHPKRFTAYRRLVVAGVMVSIPALLLFGYGVPSTYRYVGLPMQILGAAALIAGLWVRFYATCWISGYKNLTVLQDGPYCYLRHPLYLGNTLAALGVGFISMSPWVLAIAAVVLGPVFYGTALMEEGKLSEWFGAEYTEYMKRTPRFLPNGWSFLFPNYSPSPSGVAQEAFTALGYIGAAAGVTALDWLKMNNPWVIATFKPIFHVFNG